MLLFKIEINLGISISIKCEYICDCILPLILISFLNKTMKLQLKSIDFLVTFFPQPYDDKSLSSIYESLFHCQMLMEPALNKPSFKTSPFIFHPFWKDFKLIRIEKETLFLS